MASAMASVTLPSALTSSLSLSTQSLSQQQSLLVVRNSASTESASSSSGSRDPTLPSTTRRQAALSLAGLSLALLAGSSLRAEAKDIPLFGIKKKVEEVEEAVVEEVKELVKEGEAEATAVSAALAGAFSGSAVTASSSEGGLSPAFQAGVVAGAELLAVVAASTVVSGLVSQPSK